MSENLFTVKEMANACGVNSTTIHRALTSECIDAFRKRGNKAGGNLYTEEALKLIQLKLAKNNANQGRKTEAGKAVTQMQFERLENSVNQMCGLMRDQMVLMNNVLLSLTNQSKQIASLPAPALNPKDEVNKIVRAYASRYKMQYADAYCELYTEFMYRTHINASLSARNREMKTIDYIESIGRINDLLAIAKEVMNG